MPPSSESRLEAGVAVMPGWVSALTRRVRDKYKKRNLLAEGMGGAIIGLSPSLSRARRIARGARILTMKELELALPTVTVAQQAFTSSGLANWLAEYLPEHHAIAPELLNKKKIELFLSCQLAQADRASAILDAAGGKYTYLARLRAPRRYLQDRFIQPSLRERLTPHVCCICSDVRALPLADGTLDAIVCHHAFEHFVGDTDTAFIRECVRLLRPGGRLVVVPVFIADAYMEITNTFVFDGWGDDTAVRVRDVRETLPGRRRSGHFARLYDVAAFQRRVVTPLLQANCTVNLIEPLFDGRLVPDRSLPSNARKSRFNYPFRVLVAQAPQ